MTIFISILILIVTLVGLLLRFSSVKINVKQLEFVNTKIKKFKVKISLNLFNKIPWLQLTIDQEKVKKLKGSNKLEIINKIQRTKIIKDYENIGKVVKKNWKKIFGEFKKVRIEKVKLDAIIGTESANITAIATSVASISVPIIFGRKAESLSYKIKPMYKDENYIFLSLNCTISIKLVHIINVKKLLCNDNKIIK